MTKTLAVQEALSLDETTRRLRAKLEGIVPPAEIDWKAELAFEINTLKAERNAIILGHNYMEPALYHSVPDNVGDSLELARVSTQTDADIIVFCGVTFMAETAKILNPDKTVLIPSLKAGCSLAAGVTTADVRRLKALYPGVPVVTYVNTYAEVKAECDYCCTSGNAEAVIQHILDDGHDRVIFIPDEYLARNTAHNLAMDFVLPPIEGDVADSINSRKAIIGWRARCEVHEKYSVEDIRDVRKQFPDVVVLAHPECSPEVIEQCDFSGSTKQMIHYVETVPAPRYLLLTECSMGDNIAADCPDREMLRMCSVRCPYMNEITMEETLLALQQTRYAIELDADIIDRARLSIDRMLEIF